MTKFGRKARYEPRVASDPSRTVNLAGGVAYKPSDKVELVKRVLTWYVAEPKFYGNTTDETVRIMELVNRIGREDPEFILKLAVFARNVMYLRSAPVFLLVEGLSIPEIRRRCRPYVPAIIGRADALTEAIALYKARHGKRRRGRRVIGALPRQFRKGLEDAFHIFDEYQFGKYAAKEDEVKMRDVIRVVHPTPRDEARSSLFYSIRHQTVPTPVTWETILSDAKSRGMSKKEAWEFVIPKMGYMAKLRNLRNMVQSKISGESMDAVLQHLTNTNAVRNSRQFPYRFYNAYRVIQRESLDPFLKQKVLQSLEKALDTSVYTQKKIPGKTAVFVDLSGSMKRAISQHTVAYRHEVAALYGAIAHGLFDSAIVGAFAERYATVPVNPSDSVFTNMQRILSTNVGGNTNGHLAINYLTRSRIVVDRVLVFTDEQMWNSTPWSHGGRRYFAESWEEYLRHVNPRAKLYVFDLAGYGFNLTPENMQGVTQISGFSDKVFRLMEYADKEGLELVELIGSISVE